MKRMIISIMCLLLAVFLAVFGYCDLRRISTALEKQTEKLIETVESGSTADVRREAADFLKLWEKHEKMLGAFVNHEEMEQTEILIELLKKQIEANDYTHLSDELMEIQAYFAHLRDSETPKFKNIF